MCGAKNLPKDMVADPTFPAMYPVTPTATPVALLAISTDVCTEFETGGAF